LYGSLKEHFSAASNELLRNGSSLTERSCNCFARPYLREDIVHYFRGFRSVCDFQLFRREDTTSLNQRTTIFEIGRNAFQTPIYWNRRRLLLTLLACRLPPGTHRRDWYARLTLSGFV
jgi:hypothetical protein